MTPTLRGRLWAPWRRGYIKQGPPQGCFLCRARRATNDRRHWVVHRARHAFVLLNLYPYNNGHLLVAPYRHVARLDRLRDPELLECWRLADQFIRRLDRLMAPHGYNLGMNLGRSAGAGVPGHVHLHLVPRWRGDTNFMPVAGGTKVISDSLDAVYRLLTR